MIHAGWLKGSGRWFKNPWVIFSAGFLVRLIYISFLKEGYYFSDFRTYERSALSLLSGQGFQQDYVRPPFYPLFLAFNYLVFGKHFFTIRLIQCLVAAYSSVLIFQTTQLIFEQKAAKIAAWISIFYPYYVFISGLLYPTLLTTFLLIATLYLLFNSEKKKSIFYLVAASASLGLAALAVPMSLVFFPFILIWYLFFSKWEIRRRILAFSVATLVLLVTIIPWTLYCYHRTGQIVLLDSRLGEHLFIASPDVQKSRWQDTTATGRVEDVIKHPANTLKTITGEFFHFFSLVPDRIVTRDPEYRQRIHAEDSRLIVDNKFVSPWMNWVSIFSFGPLLLASILGIFYFRDRLRLLYFPIALIFSQAAGYSLFFSQVRYRLPVEFGFMILAGGALSVLCDRYFADKKSI